MNEFSYEILENITNGGGRIRTASPPGGSKELHAQSRRRFSRRQPNKPTNGPDDTTSPNSTIAPRAKSRLRSRRGPRKQRQSSHQWPSLRACHSSHATVARRHFALHTARRSCRTAQADPILARTRSQHAQHAAERAAPTTESTNVALTARRLPMLRPTDYLQQLRLAAITNRRARTNTATSRLDQKTRNQLNRAHGRLTHESNHRDKRYGSAASTRTLRNCDERQPYRGRCAKDTTRAGKVDKELSSVKNGTESCRVGIDSVHGATRGRPWCFGSDGLRRTCRLDNAVRCLVWRLRLRWEVK